MTDRLVVLLEGEIAGFLTRARGGTLQFEYADDYRDRSGATPLSVSMPHQVRSHRDRVVTPWLWGLLPENEAVLARWGRQFHVSPSSPFSLLGSPVGEDCAGAVQFVAPEEVDRVVGRGGEVTWLTDDEIGARLRDLREDATAWLGRSTTGQFSLAGAQAKTALIYENGRWGVPSGSIPTTHILKPALAGYDDHDLNEHLCLEAARRAGLVTAKTRVGQFGAESAIVVERYDRRPVEGAIIRIHQEDLCQALSVPPLRKYQSEGGPGPADLARLFRQVMPPAAAADATWRFADALIWNWLIAGTDGHAKNYALLLAGDQVRLAPLYDVASALPYDLHERKLRFAMKIGGDYRVASGRNPWSTTARELGLDAEQLVERARALASAAPPAFAEVAGGTDIASLGRALPSQLVDLVAERAGRCLQMLDAPSSKV